MEEALFKSNHFVCFHVQQLHSLDNTTSSSKSALYFCSFKAEIFLMIFEEQSLGKSFTGLSSGITICRENFNWSQSAWDSLTWHDLVQKGYWCSLIFCKISIACTSCMYLFLWIQTRYKETGSVVVMSRYKAIILEIMLKAYWREVTVIYELLF